MSFLKRGQLPILIVNMFMLIGFTFLYLAKENYEFLMYIGVIVFFFTLILATNKRHELSNGVLWGLTAWAFLHMAGGSFQHNGEIWYCLTLIPIWIHPEFVVLRYDQFVHLVGFGVATVAGYQLLKPYLKEKYNWAVLASLLIMIGLGIGALNEIIEFVAVLILPKTGVGGYFNTGWDLVFDALGAMLAAVWIYLRR